RLLDHDAGLWAALRAEAIRRAQAGTRRGAAAARLAASDIDPRAVEQARRNIERAGLPAHAIDTRVVDAARSTPPFDVPGIILANPPYGERIEAASGSAPAAAARRDATGHEQAM